MNFSGSHSEEWNYNLIQVYRRNIKTGGRAAAE